MLGWFRKRFATESNREFAEKILAMQHAISTIERQLFAHTLFLELHNYDRKADEDQNQKAALVYLTNHLKKDAAEQMTSPDPALRSSAMALGLSAAYRLSVVQADKSLESFLDDQFEPLLMLGKQVDADLFSA